MDKVLIIDDDPSICELLAMHLKERGFKTITARKGTEGEQKFMEESPNLVLLDLRLPHEDGLEILKRMRDQDTTVPIIVITGYSDLENTVKAIRLGAFEYLNKPIDIRELDSTIRRVEEVRGYKRGPGALPIELGRHFPEGHIVAYSKKMKEIFKTIAMVSESDTTVLLLGETGTGKELIAKAIHENSRKGRPFISLNCSALVETLLESELFGHEKGAFTGAYSRKIGKFEQVGEGTIFLDEIGEMSLNLQAKLLRVLQERELWRVGGSRKIETEARVIASTNRDLERLIKEGRFRDDLYYRLRVVTIEVPPLRERMEDIPHLVEYFLNRFCKELGRCIRVVPADVMGLLTQHPWPGNVRELENVLRRAVILSRGESLTVEDFPDMMRQKTRPAEERELKTLGEMERDYIAQALKSTGGNKTKACQLLGISRPTLERKMKKYRLTL